MKPVYLLGLAPCAYAIEHHISFQSPLSHNPGSCLWKLPPLRLACGLDEIDVPQTSSVGSSGGKYHGNQTGRLRGTSQKAQPPVPSERKWEGPKECLSSYCIYFNHGFANGRGIVAITTSSNLEKLKAVDEAIQSSTAANKQSDSSYMVTDIKGKGLGVIASKALSRGSSVMKKTPALLVHRSFLEGLPPSQAQQDLLDKAATYLPSTLHEEFMSQMAHFGGHKILDIIATNSFQMNLDSSGKDPTAHHYANYPEVSRFNHDCRPNVAFYIDKKTLAHTTTIVRSVKPGEELTISYLDPLKPRAARLHRANLAWGFGCTCAQCSLPDPLATKSDSRLEEISQIEGKLADIFNKEITPKMLDRLARLYQTERLESKLASPYTLLALNYNMLGEEKKAREYAKLAHEAVVIEHGEESGDAGAMLELAKNPKGHFTWRARVRK